MNLSTGSFILIIATTVRHISNTQHSATLVTIIQSLPRTKTERPRLRSTDL